MVYMRSVPYEVGSLRARVARFERSLVTNAVRGAPDPYTSVICTSISHLKVSGVRFR